MADSPIHPDAIAALAERCRKRAFDLTADADLFAIELAALTEASNQRWAAYEADKNDETRRQHIVFMERKRAVKGSMETCREDAEHYLACAAALSPILSRTTGDVL